MSENAQIASNDSYTGLQRLPFLQCQLRLQTCVLPLLTKVCRLLDTGWIQHVSLPRTYSLSNPTALEGQLLHVTLSTACNVAPLPGFHATCTGVIPEYLQSLQPLPIPFHTHQTQQHTDL